MNQELTRAQKAALTKRLKKEAMQAALAGGQAAVPPAPPQAAITVAAPAEVVHVAPTHVAQVIQLRSALDEPTQPFSPPRGLRFMCVGSDLRKVLRAALPFTSSDTSRPHLCQILLDSDGNELRVVATNGHCMYVGTVPYLDELTVGLHRISVATAAEIIDSIKAKDDTRMFYDGGANSLCRAGGLAWSIELNQGGHDFPPYRHLIGGNPRGLQGGEIEFDGKYMKTALEALSCKNVRFITHGSPENPIKLQGETVEGHWAAVIVMPTRMAR